MSDARLLRRTARACTEVKAERLEAARHHFAETNLGSADPEVRPAHKLTARVHELGSDWTGKGKFPGRCETDHGCTSNHAGLLLAR